MREPRADIAQVEAMLGPRAYGPAKVQRQTSDTQKRINALAAELRHERKLRRAAEQEAARFHALLLQERVRKL